MPNFYTDNEDLQFYVERGIDWEPLIELVEGGFRQPDGHRDSEEALAFYRDILGLVGELAAREIAPRAAEIDRSSIRLVDGEVVVPPALEEIFAEIERLDLHGMCLPRELGGSNCPVLLSMLNAELVARADVSVMAHHSFHGGIAMAMLLYSIWEGTTEVDAASGRIAGTRFGEAIQEIVRGDAWGSMDITEPAAGSDMAALRCRGEQDESGNWVLSGEKSFVTSGHGKYHFVIARTEDAGGDPESLEAGLAGLSLFLVPTFADDAQGGWVRLARLERLEEKLGHHGSVTATIVFDRTPAWLIGRRGEGFKQMLLLMNNARVSVGFEALGLCEAAWRLARDYAAQRTAMGSTIDRHALIADYLEEMRTDIQGIRALAVGAAYREEMTQRLVLAERLEAAPAGSQSERQRRRLARHKAAARRLTPLVKYLAAEKAVEIARRCLQIHGGVGYTTDYGAEKLLRDALVLPIYEGTSQIQALMAMKDALTALIKDPWALVRRGVRTRWRRLWARRSLERRVARVQLLSLRVQEHLIRRTVAGKLGSLRQKPVSQWRRALRSDWDPKRDFACALLHAERLTRLLADEAICELLYAQVRRHADRREVLERYLERAEGRAEALHREITRTGGRLLGVLDRGEETPPGGPE